MKNWILGFLLICYGMCAIILWYIPSVQQNITELAILMKHTPQILP